MNNLRLKREEGRIFASLNCNYNTTKLVNVDISNADKNQTVATAKNVKLTAKYKQAAQNAKEKIENTYNSSIDSKDSKQAKKLAFLKKIGRR
jgi:hypothetical protein